MTTILMVRHGESEANRNEIFAGHFDADLEDRGLKQAQKTAEYIKENYKVDKVYSSDLKRAFKTGKCISDLLGLEIFPTEKLREISAGKWDGMKFSDLQKYYKKEYDVWMQDIGNAHCPDGETVKELGERIMNELTRIAEENDGKTVVVATHATPIRAAQTFIQSGTFEEMKNVKWVSNASVTVLEYENKKWSCPRVSIDEHLADLKTALPTNV